MNSVLGKPLDEPALGQAIALPLFESARVQAGFPSPADDFTVKRLELNDLLITHPLATIFMRASGTSMMDAGILDGAILVVNRALRAEHGQVVVAQLDNEFTIKYLFKRGQKIKLVPANKTFPEIVPKDGQTLTIVGVVTGAINLYPPLKRN